MCDNRCKSKRLIKKVFRILDNLKLEIAYDKTMVGRTETKCFDFLGFNIGMDGLRVAKHSVRKLAERIIMKLRSSKNTGCGRVYDLRCLGANSIKGNLSIPENISKYVERWLIWIKSVNEKKLIYQTPSLHSTGVANSYCEDGSAASGTTGHTTFCDTGGAPDSSRLTSCYSGNANTSGAVLGTTEYCCENGEAVTTTYGGGSGFTKTDDSQTCQMGPGAT